MPEPERSAWRGRLWLGVGRLVYAGPIAPTTAHEHHAFQLMVALEGEFVIETSSSRIRARSFIVPADEKHAIGRLGRELVTRSGHDDHGAASPRHRRIRTGFTERLTAGPDPGRFKEQQVHPDAGDTCSRRRTSQCPPPAASA
jgi:hypothetical protein